MKKFTITDCIMHGNAIIADLSKLGYESSIDHELLVGQFSKETAKYAVTIKVTTSTGLEVTKIIGSTHPYSIQGAKNFKFSLTHNKLHRIAKESLCGEMGIGNNKLYIGDYAFGLTYHGYRMLLNNMYE